METGVGAGGGERGGEVKNLSQQAMKILFVYHKTYTPSEVRVIDEGLKVENMTVVGIIDQRGLISQKKLLQSCGTV